jgi:pyruvate kinase
MQQTDKLISELLVAAKARSSYQQLLTIITLIIVSPYLKQKDRILNMQVPCLIPAIMQPSTDFRLVLFMLKGKKTKVLATLGPSSSSEAVLVAMVNAGMNAVRINTSHSSPDEARELFELVRRVEEKTGVHIAVVFDLQGPKIRLDYVPSNSVDVEVGDIVTISVDNIPADYLQTSSGSAMGVGSLNSDKQPSKEIVLYTKYASLPSELAAGETLIIGDGEVSLVIDSTTPTSIKTKVTEGGIIKKKKGLTRPGKSFNADSLQPHDYVFIELGCKLNVDWFAVSFVRCARDMENARQAIADFKSDIPIMAKIEQPEAVDNLKEILQVSDAIMVARGDLGLFLPIEEVPLIQKRIISLCKDYALPVITATQMLESMIENDYPTRAEVSDVANAILDGTDAVMLSGETATGKYPVHVIEMMRRIALATEPTIKMPIIRGSDLLALKDPIGARIASGACRVAADLDAAAIIAPTVSGYSARNVARFRPVCPIIAPTASIEVARRLALSSGVLPVLNISPLTVEYGLYEQLKHIPEIPVFEKDDILVFLGGIPSKVKGNTNFIKVETVS